LVVVKSFSGAKTNQMTHYVAPTLEEEPDILILHVGTNDFKRIDDPDMVGKNIINLAEKCTNEDRTQVVISSLTPRNDRYAFKINDVNKILKEMCEERNISLIDNSNILKSHINGSRVHLKPIGDGILARNFKEVISN